MKKIFAVLLILGFAVTAVCADDFPTGKWLDENWNGIWEFEVGNSVKLLDTEGNLIYNFTKDKIQNFRIWPTEKGLSLSFYCPETARAYEFIKPITLSADLELVVNPDWTDEDYSTTIKFKR